MSEEKKDSAVAENVKTVVYAVLIALFVRTFFIEPFSIPSGSMIPTLLVGDYLFVSKYTYGYSRHSFPRSMPLFKGRIFYTEPKRGDVIVFKVVNDGNKDYIKRLIGLPGDRIQVKKGRLYINGELVKRKAVGEVVMRSANGSAIHSKHYIETLPEGKEHPIYEMSDDAMFDKTEELKVPEGHFFMMGDNRDNSSDSRSTVVGYVPYEALIGKARFIFFSRDDDACEYWEIWKWPMAVRWSRIFDKIK